MINCCDKLTEKQYSLCFDKLAELTIEKHVLTVAKQTITDIDNDYLLCEINSELRAIDLQIADIQCAIQYNHQVILD